MYEYIDLEEKRIDTSKIAICKKIRGLAKLDRVQIGETEVVSSINKHLINYIEYCGVNVENFIKQYLSNLQPYMIESKQEDLVETAVTCIIDNLYKISVTIESNTNQFETIQVHFNNDRSYSMLEAKSSSYRYTAIFADSISSKVSNENKYAVKAFFQRGILVLPLELPAVKCKDIFIVERKAIDKQLLEYCKQYICDLYTSNLKLNFDEIEVFTMLQQLSSTSYGKDIFSSISLLIDSLCIQKDFISKSVADFAIVTFIQSLKLTPEQQAELKTLLDKKYLTSGIEGIQLILHRVNENISISTV
jgi:hypothetical protein